MSSFLNYILLFLVSVINNEISALSFNQPTIEPNATWCENGITIVDNNILGGRARALYIDNDNTIFVASHVKSRIFIWSDGDMTSIRSVSINLYEYTPLLVTLDDEMFFESGDDTGRIEKWMMTSNKTTFVTKFSDHCYGLFIDVNNTLYCSLRWMHRVVKISLDEKDATEINVVGTGSMGDQPNEVCAPWGIFVDTNFDLYVADAGNNRIQLFRAGQVNGETVAGRGIPPNLDLSHPNEVIFDADGYMYIADAHNNRVIRSGYGEWQCIIGCNNDNKGSAPNQLQNSYSLRFDTRGNLYVADESNNRIQKFTVATNSFETLATTTSTIDYKTSSISITSTEESTEPTTSSSPFTCSIGNGVLIFIIFIKLIFISG